MTFLFPLIGLIVGIICGNLMINLSWGIIPVAVAVCVNLWLLKKGSNPLGALKYNHVHKIWILFLFIGVGFFVSYYHRPSDIPDSLLENIAGGKGEVKEIRSFANGDRITLNLNSVADNKGNVTECRNIKILLYTNGLSSKIGDIIIFKGKLTPIADNPNYPESGYASRLKREGILYKASAFADNIRITGYNNSLMAKSAGWRDRIEIALEKSSLNRGAIDYLIAFMLGDKSFLNDDIKESFSNNGVAHILALSGMHVAIIMGILMCICFPLAFMGLDKPRYWIALTGIWIYAFLSGLAPSTFRAAIMLTFIILALTFQRRRNVANALVASSIVIIALDPAAIYDPGLQLSLLSVACILMFPTQLNPVNRNLRPKLYVITSSVLVSLVAAMGTWVLVSYYFKRIPLMFLPANLLILPFLPIYMTIALLYIGFLMFGIDMHVLATFLNFGYNAIMYLLDAISTLGQFTIDFRATLPMVILWILGLLVLGYAINRKKKVVTVTLGILFLFLSILAGPFLASSSNDCMIFQKNYKEISMIFYKNGESQKEIFPKNTVSCLSKGSSDIFTIDCKNFIDSLPRLITKSEPVLNSINKSFKAKKRKRYLLISEGVGEISLKNIPGINYFDKVILHSSLRKKREKQLIEEARNLGLTSIHSLRLDGPLEVEL